MYLFTEFCLKIVESAVDILEMIMREDPKYNS